MTVLSDKWIKKISKQNNFFLINDKHTLDEVCGLVEWPNSLVGKIDESFMSLPREVLMTVMKVHQKYFAVEDASHLIQPTLYLFQICQQKLLGIKT